MKYKIKKRKVLKKLAYDKLNFVENIFDNEYLGLILGYTFGYILIVLCFIPCFIISLFQFKSYYNKIKYDIEKRPENIRNWEHLDLVEKDGE